MADAPEVKPFFHGPTGTWSYVVSDPGTGQAAIIDPVLDYDPESGHSGTDSAAAIADHVEAAGLTVEWILETHAHADHLSAARYLQTRLGGTLAIGAGIRAVQRTLAGLLDLGADFATDGSQFDHLFDDGDTFRVGRIGAQVIAVPGHTSDAVAYRVGDAVFCGDTLFMPDGGTARCDFPGGDAACLYRSIMRLYELPGGTRMFVCHDYGPGGRGVRCETSVAEQRARNIHVRDGVSVEEFVALRDARDATLAPPALMEPALRLNLAGAQS